MKNGQIVSIGITEFATKSARWATKTALLQGITAQDSCHLTELLQFGFGIPEGGPRTPAMKNSILNCE
jgi:hypothetical protein